MPHYFFKMEEKGNNAKETQSHNTQNEKKKDETHETHDVNNYIYDASIMHHYWVFS